MKTHDLFLIDVFTDRRLAGNPCAVVFESDDLDAATMQAIAREMNLSETAFLLRSEESDVRARYFTPAEEIPLAGHPTLAVVWALLETGRFVAGASRTSWSLELRDGPVRVEADPSVSPPLLWMEQRRPVFGRVYDPLTVLPVFGLEIEDVLPGAAVQTVSTGTPQLMIPLATHAALRRAVLDIAAYVDLRAAGDFFSPHLFCLGGFTPDGDTAARHFGTPPDTLEDPFTGSATGGMAAYLWRYGLLDSPDFVAEQGHPMERPGRAKVEVVGPREEIETVRVGGHAVTVLTGRLRV